MENPDFDSLDETDEIFEATLKYAIVGGIKRSGCKRKRVIVKRVAMGGSKRSKRVPLVPSRGSEVSEGPPKRVSTSKSKTLDSRGSDPGDNIKGPCKVCMKMTTKMCICQQEFYCSKKHEEQDYSSHKSKCYAFTVPMKRSLQSFVTQSTRSSYGNTTPVKGVMPLEDRYVVARKRIEQGTVLFKESPILVAPNYITPKCDSHDKKKVTSYCLGCFEDFAGFLDQNHKNIVFSTCPSCKLPLCKNCYKGKENGKHSQHECMAIKEASKLGDVLKLKDKCPYQSEELIKDLTVLRAILLQKTNVAHWTAFINLKFNVRFTQSLRTTPDVVKTWVKTKTPISENYINGLQENFFRLEDVKRIIALFSNTSKKNSRIRILYDFISWMPQSCTPSAAIYFAEGKTHEISVKSVDEIDAGKEITVNYISGYDGGLLKSTLNLYSKTGMVCGCNGCKHNLYDTTVGVYCNNENCKGFMSPKMFRIEPGTSFPDIYSPNYVWQCDMCKKPRRFNSIQKHVEDTLKEVKKDVFDLSKNSCEKSESVLRENVEKKLHWNHWLSMKLDKIMLKSLDIQIGFGNEMLRTAVSQIRQQSFIYLLEKKRNIYFKHGRSGKQGFLKKITEMRGPVSEIVGIYQFDASYVLFIDFLERYKVDCQRDWNVNKINKKSMSSLHYMHELNKIICLFDDVHTSLFSSTNFIYRSYARIAKETFDVYTKVYEKLSICVTNTYLQDLLASYTLNDPKFPRSIFKGIQKKPENRLLFEDDEEFTIKFEDLQIEGCEDEKNNKDSLSNESSEPDSYLTGYTYDYESSSSEFGSSRHNPHGSNDLGGFPKPTCHSI